MVHDVDPKQKIVDDIGQDLINDTHVHGDQILLGVYERPEKLASGLFLSDKTKDEDRHQGKVGLVIKVGDTAFSYRGQYKWTGKAAQVGDWVVIRASDGWALELGGKLCRMVDCAEIRLTVPEPDVVW
jgi:co-chaperonin GroES (HSP10)